MFLRKDKIVTSTYSEQLQQSLYFALSVKFTVLATVQQDGFVWHIFYTGETA